MTTRVFPPTGARSPVTFNGRTYSGVPGSYQDVPDDDALTLASNGWTIVSRTCQVGAAAARPTSSPSDGTRPAPGQLFLDTTLGYVVIWDGASWRNPASGAAV